MQQTIRCVGVLDFKKPTYSDVGPDEASDGRGTCWVRLNKHIGSSHKRAQAIDDAVTLLKELRECAFLVTGGNFVNNPAVCN